MKHLLRIFCLLLAAVMLASMLTSCGLVKRFFNGDEGSEGLYGSYTGEMVKDAYGFERPQTCFLTESLLFAEQPALTELFGTAGESGLVNEALLQNDGNIVPNEKNYLVCLYYGSLPDSDMPIGSYLEFTVIDGNQILHGSDCVEGVWVKSWNGDLDDPSVLYMYREPDQRLTFQNPGKNVIQGAIVIEFVPKVVGTLVAELYLEVETFWEDVEHQPYRVDRFDTAQLGSGGTAQYARSECILTEYFTESAYNHGDYSMDDVSYVASFDNGKSCYMIFEYYVTATESGHGGAALELLIFVKERGTLDVRLEEAPTDSFETFATKEGFGIRISFQMPDEAGEQKHGRIAVRLTPISGGVADVCALFLDGGNAAISGNCYFREEISIGEGAVKYAPDDSGEHYVVRGCGQGADYIEIFDELGGGIPVIAIAEAAFADCESLVSVSIGKNVKTIEQYAFYNCPKLSYLTYAGTMAEWEQITKGTGWKAFSPLEKIICSDGEISFT